MKKILWLSFLLPFPVFAASFYRMNQVGAELTVIETYPALGIVMVEEDGGYPNQVHYLNGEKKSVPAITQYKPQSKPSRKHSSPKYSSYMNNYSVNDWYYPGDDWYGGDDWYYNPIDDGSWWDWFPPDDGSWWDWFPPDDGSGWDWCPPGWEDWCWPWPTPDPEPNPDPDPDPDPDPGPTPGNVTWGIDRINQRNLPLDGQYGLKGSSSVTAFIVDTGIQPQDEFGSNLLAGYDATGDGATTDCMGHGTHVAGTVGSQTYGVAFGTQIVPVKVFSGCSESTTTQLILRGLDYVASSTARPAVVNMSLGGEIDEALDNAVSVLINKGINVVVAAGNDGADACNDSPARLGGSSAVISVGSTDRTDNISSFSNTGSCVNIYAPGEDIESLSPSSGIVTMSGTSMASPHVAGTVALYLANNPEAAPADVKAYLDSVATTGVLTQYGSPFDAKLVYAEGGAKARKNPR